MRSLRSLRLPLHCLIVLCLLATPANASGYVWCLGTDGHAELEAATAGDCSLDCATPYGATRSISINADEDGCGPCLDIVSTHQLRTHRSFDVSQHLVLPVNLPQPAVAVTHEAVIQPIANRLIVEATPRTPDPILLHRTTVLLI